MSTRGAPKQEKFNGPKKPASGSYFLWCSENRQAVMADIRRKAEAEGKKFAVTEVGITLAERYKVECTEEQKKAYAEKSVVSQNEYQEKLKAWKETEQFSEFIKAKEIYNKKLTGRKEKKELKDAGQPTKPKSGYLTFVNEIRADVTAQLKKEHGEKFKFGMVAGRCAENWKKLSAEDRIPYEKKAAEEKAGYKIAFAEFQETDTFKAIEAKKEKKKKVANRVRRSRKAAPAGESATATEPGAEEEEVEDKE